MKEGKATVREKSIFSLLLGFSHLKMHNSGNEKLWFERQSKTEFNDSSQLTFEHLFNDKPKSIIE